VVERAVQGWAGRHVRDPDDGARIEPVREGEEQPRKVPPNAAHAKAGATSRELLQQESSTGRPRGGDLVLQSDGLFKGERIEHSASL
jgi:hypothetical protein